MSAQDVASIIKTLNLYALAMDTQRWDLFDRIFTADVDADYADPAHWRDLESFRRDFAAYHAPFDSTQHVMMNHLVEVSGDVARAFVYGSWLLIKRGTEGGDFWQGTGWYDDALVRADGGWKIKRRACRVVWQGGNPRVNAPASPDVSFDTASKTLREEAAAGRVEFVNATWPK
ncbi:nuclear transport factor 2 family protein [Phenylobacterium sp. LjRoot225]|uniref:nuclear transport factor 2 family protein n=1 Tax=Phenylobacterium sp. LjRoot225 TaxID=3342285 RepID=UPI003ECE391B